MATLARYFQQTSRQAVETPLSVADVGGEQIGLAIAGLGQAVDEIAQRDEQFWLAKTFADIDQDARTYREQSIANAGDGAAGFENGYLGLLDQRYEQARQTAPSGRALRAFEMQAVNHRSSQQDWAFGFASQEKVAFRADTIRNEADNMAQEFYRYPGVGPYSPVSGLNPPALPAGSVPANATDYWSSGTTQPHSGVELPRNLDQWESRYYVPQDFADGANMGDRSGDVMVSKRTVSALDWVTDQFGRGKLQINSGYRSPASNVARASSGPEGPHTHGEALDIQVRDLPQAEKNRLYSLFRAAGANAFGFGDGVLHVEWRQGQSTSEGSRDGDFEWTYGNAQKYDRVPVAGPGQVGGPSTDAAGGWQSINQYPWLSSVAMTARQETGTTDLATASLSIVPDSNGTRSYGPMGLNTRGMLPGFVRDYGERFGLTARAGTPEFDAQWTDAVRRDPEGMIRAQLEFHEAKVVRPAQRGLVAAGAVAVANDPRVVAFASDLVTQYGATIAQRHMNAGAGAGDATSFINAVTESTRRSLNSDFASALNENPNIRTGLLNRIDNRARDAMGVSPGGAIATGMVPAWNGPVPNIEDIPGYQERMDRLDQMIDSMGGTPAQRRELRQGMEAQIVRSWLTRMAQVNPPAAMAALMSGRYDQQLQISDTVTLMNASESAYGAMQREIQQAHKDLVANLKIEAQSLFADEVASISSTGNSLGRLTDSHIAVLSDKEKSDLAFARFAYDTQQTINTAATHEFAGILEELQPEGDGFAEELRRYNFAQEAIQERIEQQRNDPAGLVTRTYPQLEQALNQALSSGDSNAVSSTIKAIRAAQEMAGVPPGSTMSIPQTLMVANQEMLTEAETADEAFSRFMQLKQTYGDEFGNVIADMERAGLPRGWAATNELIDSGNIIPAKFAARLAYAGEWRADAEVGMMLARAGQAPVAQLIFNGRLKRSEVPNLIPSGRDGEIDENILQIFNRVVGDAFGENTKDLQGAREAALSAYAAQASLGEELDGARLEEALQMVTGGILEWNASGNRGKFLAPLPGMTQAEFTGLAVGITDDMLDGAYIGYATRPEKVTAQMLRDTMQLETAGNGVYYLRYPGAGLARDETGNPFEFDMMASLSTLQQSAAERYVDPATIVEQAPAGFVAPPQVVLPSGETRAPIPTDEFGSEFEEPTAPGARAGGIIGGMANQMRDGE